MPQTPLVKAHGHMVLFGLPGDEITIESEVCMSDPSKEQKCWRCSEELVDIGYGLQCPRNCPREAPSSKGDSIYTHVSNLRSMLAREHRWAKAESYDDDDRHANIAALEWAIERCSVETVGRITPSADDGVCNHCGLMFSPTSDASKVPCPQAGCSLPKWTRHHYHAGSPEEPTATTALRAENVRLGLLVSATVNHWLSLQGEFSIPWEGAIDAAMEAACNEIRRLRSSPLETMGDVYTQEALDAVHAACTRERLAKLKIDDGSSEKASGECCPFGRIVEGTLKRCEKPKGHGDLHMVSRFGQGPYMWREESGEDTSHERAGVYRNGDPI